MMDEFEQDRHHYRRYHIETNHVADIVAWPNRFLVKVNRFQLARLLLEEIFHQRGDYKAITSRPCVYGTFSGPVGGFAPRPQHCVGCLRCMTQHPNTVKILPNPERQSLGDSYFQASQINAIAYESETGSIPVKGAGYRGKFGGSGWDGMWTDMSEIVRPTRDGIHGREFISTQVDIGEKCRYLVFDEDKLPIGDLPKMVSLPIPFIYNLMPNSVESELVYQILFEAAGITETMVEIPLGILVNLQNEFVNEERGGQVTRMSKRVIPVINPEEIWKLNQLRFTPTIIALDQTEQPIPELLNQIRDIRATLPDVIFLLRLPYPDPERLLAYVGAGINVFHLVSNYHGRNPKGQFVLDLIREIHLALVSAGNRETVTLIGSGGITAAEHVPKAIISGLDVVALDTPLLAALQAMFVGECSNRTESIFKLSSKLTTAWGTQRLVNLTAAWRDQLLEILGAMGLREVRRLRGEIGRAMFQVDLEQAAFGEIEGFEGRLN